MNLNSNASKAIAALVVLNAVLFLSHHPSMVRLQGPVVLASISASNPVAPEICRARTQARIAAFQARIQARAAQRQALEIRRRVEQQTSQTGTTAPSSCTRTRASVTGYVQSLMNLSSRAIHSGI